MVRIKRENPLIPCACGCGELIRKSIELKNILLNRIGVANAR